MFSACCQFAFWKCQWVLALLVLAKASARRPRSILVAPEPSDVTPVDPTVACALSLTRSQLADSSHIIVRGEAPWLGDFLKAADVSVTLLQSGDERGEVHNLRFDVAFLVTDGGGNRSFVQETLTHFGRRQLSYARVVVWWRGGDAQAAVDAAWDLEVVRLAVVSTASRTPRVFGYREECENGSVVARAVLVGECGPAGELQADGDVFPDLLRWNLHGCPLRLSIPNVPPFHVINASPNGGYTMAGIYSPLALAVAKRMNATLDVSNWSITQGFGGASANGTMWGAVGDLMLKKRDVYFAKVIRNPPRNMLVAWSPSFYMHCFSFFVPSGLGARPGRFELVYREFSPAVWALVGMSYLVVLLLLALSWAGVWEHPVQDAALYTLSALLGNPVVRRMTATRDRVLIVFWVMLCIVLGTAYHAAHHSLVAAPRQAPEINSLPELAEAGLTVVGFPVSLNVLDVLAASDQGNTTLRALSARAELVTDIGEAVYRMATKRDIATINDPTTLRYIAGQVDLAAGRKLVHEIPGYCPYTVHCSDFLFRPGSRLLPLTSKLMFQAMDMGLFAFMKKQMTFSIPKANKRWSLLDLSKLRAAFELLGIGLASCVLVFTIEILVHTHRPKATAIYRD